MRYVKTFENFEQPEGTGADSFWEVKRDDKTIRITLNDIKDYLDNYIEIDPKEVKNLLIDVTRDPIRVDVADLSYPVILSKSKGKYNRIIDGQHRIVKALRDDVNIKAKILDLDSAPEVLQSIFL